MKREVVFFSLLLINYFLLQKIKTLGGFSSTNLHPKILFVYIFKYIYIYIYIYYIYIYIYIDTRANLWVNILILCAFLNRANLNS